MTNVVKVFKIIMQLLPYILDILEFLEGIRDIRKTSGDQVAKVITSDAAHIAKNWKQYLEVTRAQQQQINNEKGGVE